MKIMTFNTQHCRNYLEDKIDFEIMANTIKNFNPDIVGLNEMYGAGEHENFTNQIGTLASLCGYPHSFFAETIRLKSVNPYGIGLLSSNKIDDCEVIPIPLPERTETSPYYEPRCILKAKIDGLNILITHFGLTPPEHKLAVQTVMEHITDTKCILMGDFNVTPENDILAPIRTKLKDTADFFESPCLGTFPSDTPDRKIDYIFVSHDLKVLSASVPEIIASDHRPHIAEIDFNIDN